MRRHASTRSPRRTSRPSCGWPTCSAMSPADERPGRSRLARRRLAGRQAGLPTRLAAAVSLVVVTFAFAATHFAVQQQVAAIEKNAAESAEGVLSLLDSGVT